MGQAVIHQYPELAAGGFTRVDGTVQFYTRVRALLAECGAESVVVDFGAGRGLWASSDVALHRQLLDLRAPGRKVVGVDLDPAVRENPLLDEALVIQPGAPIPLRDASVDLVVTDHTFEHIEDAAGVADELRRIVRPGGWICARTPNKWGYIALAARAVPNPLHTRVLHRVQPQREDRDVFPTWYRLNTRRDLERHFPSTAFDHVVYGWDPEPAYGASSRTAGALFRLAGRLTPEALRPTLLIFLHHRGDDGLGTSRAGVAP